MRKLLCAIALATSVVVFTQAPAHSVSPRAQQLHDRAIVVDSHGDTTERLIFDEAFDICKRNPNGNIDIPRMREGGLEPGFRSSTANCDITPSVDFSRLRPRLQNRERNRPVQCRNTRTLRSGIGGLLDDRSQCQPHRPDNQ
jgi:hypothetical protein